MSNKNHKMYLVPNPSSQNDSIRGGYILYSCVFLFSHKNYESLDIFTANFETFRNTGHTRHFFILYKNTLYKSVHDENGQKIKNIVRILPS